MARTQIQLPDESYARAKKLCEAREISLAELARRGIEYILSVYAPEPDANRDWQPLKPRKLGWMPHRIRLRFLRWDIVLSQT